MGGCFSDVRGGQQAAGGGENDAINLFFRTKALFTKIKVKSDGRLPIRNGDQVNSSTLRRSLGKTSSSDIEQGRPQDISITIHFEEEIRPMKKLPSLQSNDSSMKVAMRPMPTLAITGQTAASLGKSDKSLPIRNGDEVNSTLGRSLSMPCVRVGSLNKFGISTGESETSCSDQLLSEVDIEQGRPKKKNIPTNLQGRAMKMVLNLPSNDSGMKAAMQILAITGQTAASLVSTYTLNGPSSSAEVTYLLRALYFVMAANAVGFTATLSAILLHPNPKNKGAASILEKIGAVAGGSGIIVAMGMFLLPKNIIWISGFACLIPCIAVALTGKTKVE